VQALQRIVLLGDDLSEPLGRRPDLLLEQGRSNSCFPPKYW